MPDSASHAAPAPSAPPEATHPCVRCGARVPLDVSLCESCNPLGLSQPATSQAHGTVFVAIALAVAGLAVAGRLALAGIGPFTGQVSTVEGAPGGLAITLTVKNEGSKAGSTTCRVTDPAKNGVGPAAVLLSPRIDAGQTRSFSTTVEQFGAAPRPLAVQCEAP